MSVLSRLKLKFAGSGVTVTKDDAGRDVITIAGGSGGGGSETDPVALAALSTHEADTTAIHGITDTAALVVTTDPRLSDARTPTAHTHDDRYFTETEVNTALSGKSNTGHGHAFTEITGTATDAQIPASIARDSELHAQQHSVTSLTDHTFPGGTTNFLRADGTWSAPPAGGGGLPAESSVVLGADHVNSTTTPGAVTGLAGTLGVGTWLAKYWLVYRTAATTTGIQMYLDHTGTTSRLVGTWYQLTTGGAAATGVGDQATVATAQMLEGKGQRAEGVTTGTTQGVDTANADQFAVFEALIVVTASGTLNLMMNSEVAGSAATIMSGSTLMLTQVA